MAKKKIQVPVTIVKEEPESFSKKFWKFFKNSGTILWARLQTLVGVVVGAVGAMDFSPLWNTLKTGTFFTKQQLIAMGIGIVGAGVVTEVVRRSNTKEVAGNLLPKSSS